MYRIAPRIFSAGSLDKSGIGEAYIALGLALAACQKGLSVGFTATIIRERPVSVKPNGCCTSKPAIATLMGSTTAMGTNVPVGLRHGVQYATV